MAPLPWYFRGAPVVGHLNICWGAFPERRRLAPHVGARGAIGARIRQRVPHHQLRHATPAYTAEGVLMLEEGQDRRVEERSSCDLFARIQLPDGQPALTCTVKDISPTGAKIEIADAARLPDEFDLLVPIVPGADQTFHFKVLWRGESAVGGEFRID